MRALSPDDLTLHRTAFWLLAEPYAARSQAAVRTKGPPRNPLRGGPDFNTQNPQLTRDGALVGAGVVRLGARCRPRLNLLGVNNRRLLVGLLHEFSPSPLEVDRGRINERAVVENGADNDVLPALE